MPILGGEAVVGYVLKYVTDKVSIEPTSYSSEYAKPISLPIRGCYDDYGGIEGYEKGLAARMASTGLNISVDDVVRSLERGEIAGYGLVMMHASIHDGLVNFMQDEMNANGYYGKPANLSVDDVLKQLEEEDEMDKMYEAAKKNPSKKNIEGILSKSVEATKRMLQTLEGISSTGPDYGGLKELFRKTAKKSKKKLVEEYVRGSNELKAISTCMERMRKLWFIPCGAGSQGQDFEYYLVLAELMRKQVFKSMGDSPEDTAYIYKTLLKTT